MIPCRHSMYRRALLLAALAGLSPAATADTLTVGPGLGTYDFLTITAAVASAVDGDEIVIEPGVYPENIVISNRDITLRRSANSGDVIVFGQSLGSVIVLDASVVTLQGLTITGGLSDIGAGVFSPNDSEVTIESCIIENNVANSGSAVGGGVYASRRLTMRDSIVRNNSSQNRGGGVDIRGVGPHVIERSHFESNSAGDVDASPDAGGAIATESTDETVIRESVFVGNSSTWRGGAIATFINTTRLENCTFETNSSPRGGVLWISDNDAVLASNCLFIENDAAAFGGVVYNEQLFDAVNCTFVGNTDGSDNDSFQGVRADAVARLRNCVVTNPGAGSHGGIGIYDPHYSLIPEATAMPDSSGNFSADPMFVDGFGGDYRLMAGSPAIDAGDSLDMAGLSGISVLTLAADLDGNVRNLDDQSAPNAGIPAWELNIDMGAYEFQPSNAGPGCSIADVAAPFGVLNFFDVAAYISEFNVGCP